MTKPNFFLPILNLLCGNKITDFKPFRIKNKFIGSITSDIIAGFRIQSHHALRNFVCCCLKTLYLVNPHNRVYKHLPIDDVTHPGGRDSLVSFLHPMKLHHVMCANICNIVRIAFVLSGQPNQHQHQKPAIISPVIKPVKLFLILKDLEPVILFLKSKLKKTGKKDSGLVRFEIH